MRAEYISHVGAVRENNEDAVYCDRKAGIFVVADGLGGREAGEIASATAVRILAEHFWVEQDGEPAERLREAFYEANDFLYRRGQRRELEGMGTTMTAAVCQGDRLTIAHVGDSRAYLINRQGYRQLTQDHSLVAEMVREGRLSEDEARNHPRRNILTRALGQEALVEVDTVEESWRSGDYLLLCSDGLYNLVSPEEMQEFLMRATLLKTAAGFMVDTANRRGGFDNISVLIAAHD